LKIEADILYFPILIAALHALGGFFFGAFSSSRRTSFDTFRKDLTISLEITTQGFGPDVDPKL
jgi:hypothetical protein